MADAPTRRDRRPRRGPAFRIAVRMVGVAAIVLLLAALYLNRKGFPEPVAARLREALARAGLDARFERLRLSERGELLAEDLAVFLVPDDPRPHVLAESLALDVDLFDAARGRLTVRGARLRNAIVHWPAAAGGDEGPPALERISVALRFEPAGLRVTEARANVRGLEVTASGLVAGSPERRAGADAGAWAPRLREWMERRPAFWRRLRGEAGALEFGGGSRAAVDFLVVADRPDASECSLEWTARETRFRGIRFSALTGRARWRAGAIELESAEARVRDGAASLAGRWDGAGGRLCATSSLPWSVVSHLPLPARARSFFEALDLEGPGAIEIEASAERSPAGGPARLRGRAAVRQVGIEGVWVERADFAFERAGARLDIRDVDAVVGRGRGRGPLRGEGFVAFDTRGFGARGSAAFDPREALGLLRPDEAAFVGAAQFPADPPAATFDTSGSFADPKAFRFDARVAGTNFAYNGTAVARASMRVAFAGGVLRFEELSVARPEGELAGRVVQDTGAGEVEFDVVSTLDPQAAARLAGAFAHRFLQQFRFEGPCRVAGRGRANYRVPERQDFTVDVDGERLGLLWWCADRARFRCRGVGTRVTLEGIEGAFGGGDFAGTVVIDWSVTPGEPARYDVRGQVCDAEFAAFLSPLAQQPPDRFPGRLSADVSMAGAIGRGQARSARGEGSIEIARGELFRIPLFGGLSRYLSKLYPGLGYASQTDLRADFTIRDGRARSENVFIEGSLLSLAASGEYRFDGSLRGVVRTRLLNTGAVAHLVQVLTFPLSKLFEFELSGTLRDPHWRPRNLPKEIFPGGDDE